MSLQSSLFRVEYRLLLKHYLTFRHLEVQSEFQAEDFSCRIFWIFSNRKFNYLLFIFSTDRPQSINLKLNVNFLLRHFLFLFNRFYFLCTLISSTRKIALFFLFDRYTTSLRSQDSDQSTTLYTLNVTCNSILSFNTALYYVPEHEPSYNRFNRFPFYCIIILELNSYIFVY